MEKNNEPPEENVKAHNLAIQLAKSTGNVKREATAYQNFAAYLKSLGKSEESGNYINYSINEQFSMNN
jgi:hypothetical protein